MGAYLSTTHTSYRALAETGSLGCRETVTQARETGTRGARAGGKERSGRRNSHTGKRREQDPRAPGGRRELDAWMRGTGARLVGCAPQAALLGGSADLAVCADSDVGWVSIVQVGAGCVGAGCVPVWSMSCRVLPPLVLVLCSVSRSGSWACELSVLVECELDF
ncbi:hypothetical protein OH76DRAFT_298355 [Lentinus brumalis]|uniref:Uncharacterized protein n=1 Tax=Lentinus brumalis TaxID=2498619 RepID=A0A371DG31_9APHY|nr:hypothetical protein OH76DRAFT_298355 [Polyporus brumalis]